MPAWKDFLSIFVNELHTWLSTVLCEGKSRFTLGGLDDFTKLLPLGSFMTGVGAFEANRMRSGDHREFDRSTSTGKPLLNREDEIALGKSHVPSSLFRYHTDMVYNVHFSSGSS
jgi:hypothetical protein